jgi:NADH-quinone oxidoreductase subunit C
MCGLSLLEEEEITKRIVERFPETTLGLSAPNRINLFVALGYLPALAIYLRDTEGFDHVTSVTGIDYPSKNLVTVTYHLGAYAKSAIRRIVLSISIDLPRQDPKMPSLSLIWPSTEYHERETHEMIGVIFQDHPDLSLLLLPEDWTDKPPLRKDFKLRGR